MANSKETAISAEELAQLQQDSAILREIRKHMDFTYFIFDIHGQLMAQSDNIERLSGWTAEDFKDKHVTQPVEEAHMANLMTAVHEASRKPGEAVDALYTLRKKDGSHAEIEAKMINLARDERIGGYLGLSQFIDKQRQLEREIKSLQAQVAQIQQLDVVGTLASGIAHDFNNVLQAVIGNAELGLLEVEEKSLASYHFEKINEAGCTAQNLVTKLLSFAKKRILQKNVINLSSCLEESISLLGMAVRPGVDIITEIDADVGHIWDDATNMHQLVLNLGTNAVAAVSEGGKVTISLKTFQSDSERKARIGKLRKGRYAHLTFRDDGRGMSKALLEKVFQPFVTTKSSGNGTGLGLAVVANIIKSQGGALEVRSKVNRGTVFDVFIPLISAEEATIHRLPDIQPEGSEAIAVIDDDPGVLFVAKTFLEQLGYKTTHYSSGQAFLDDIAAGRRAFDVIVTDLTMPGMSGVHLARHLSEHNPDLPVIITSGFEEPLHTVDSLPKSIKASLSKPYSAISLGKTIRRVLASRGGSGTRQ